MPGVPSFKGCEGCRKQKKKCDQNKPACSRCTRLQIPCIGCGQQRYKFKNQTVYQKSHDPSQLALSKHESTASSNEPPAAPLSNPTTRVIGGLVSALAVTDLRYELSIYGDFLPDIPKRLGRNAALDSSVAALTTAFQAVHTGLKPAEVYLKYATALSSLRRCLSDPVEAQSPETLCAIWLIVICQGWIGGVDDNHACHGAAMSHLLNVAMSRECKSKFEIQLARTLSTVVILESFYNPRIALDHSLWAADKAQESPKPNVVRYHASSLELRQLARISMLLRRPERDFAQVKSTYDHVREDCSKLEALLSKAPITRSPEGVLITDLALEAKRLHVRQQTGHGILLMIALALNSTLQTHNPFASDAATMTFEADNLVDQALTLAEQATQYRPLAASATPLCLIVAWAVTQDVVKRERLQELLNEYEKDFASVRWRDQAVKVRERLRGRRLDMEPISMVIT